MNKLQLSMLCSNQILVIKTGMELTSQVKTFRASFKKMVGLRRNATHLEVLGAIKQVYEDNNILDEFLEKIKRLRAEDLLTQI